MIQALAEMTESVSVNEEQDSRHVDHVEHTDSRLKVVDKSNNKNIRANKPAKGEMTSIILKVQPSLKKRFEAVALFLNVPLEELILEAAMDKVNGYQLRQTKGGRKSKETEG